MSGVYWGWQVDWEPDHIGPQSRVSALPLVPWGGDLPGQDQASNKNELCRLLYTFGTIFCECFHIHIYAMSSHILTCNIKKCYMDYFLHLCISLHYQSDVLQHNGTNYKQLYFSSDILAGMAAQGICAFFYMSN